MASSIIKQLTISNYATITNEVKTKALSGIGKDKKSKPSNTPSLA